MDFLFRNWYSLRNWWTLYVHAAREHMQDSITDTKEEMKELWRYTRRVHCSKNDPAPLLEKGSHQEIKHEILHKVVAHKYSCDHHYIPEVDYHRAHDHCPVCAKAGRSQGFLVRVENDRNVGIVSIDIL
jgi:hypothetical protein